MSKKIQVISPHFDDAVLSCAQHILDWQAEGYEVEVITVFTEFEASVLSEDSASFVKECGVKSLAAFRKLREREDTEAMKRLGVKKYKWLGFIDGGFREENGKPVYFTHDYLFAGKISDSSEWRDRLTFQLKKAIDTDSTVVLPLGIGGHADHHIVKQSAEGFCSPKHLSWYMDVPYAFQLHNLESNLVTTLVSSRASWKWSSKSKLHAVEAYEAQVPILFPQGLWEYPEIVVKR